ncbi:hypothetical protein [Schumannella soli]|uniref:Uncharacterized protein n=1 Tax=Schumannella soli TaxID=2590779 RepID=A0A506YBD2_9MICO|nr:hypothetical protein [Schumannella soli]TPW77789.1 hypothetical protein FJ657_03835 [Schumannella soli]
MTKPNNSSRDERSEEMGIGYPPPEGPDLDARLRAVRRSVLRRIVRRPRWWQVAAAVVVVAGAALGGASASVAFYPTKVTSGAFVKPAYADQVAACLADRGWQPHVLSDADSRRQYEPGDAVVIEFVVDGRKSSELGRDVDKCRSVVEKRAGESTLPDSIANG